MKKLAAGLVSGHEQKHETSEANSVSVQPRSNH
jgi:hypothetical protein